VRLVTTLTVGGLLLTTIFVADGHLGRSEGLALVVAWAAATVVTVKALGGGPIDDPPLVRHDGKLAQALVTLGALGLVGGGATLAVYSLVRLAERIGVPEFVLAFFGASVGTSLPEIFVDITALRRGAPGIALGDALGSSLVDSTLSIGMGPLVAPADVTARLAVVAALYTALAIATVGALLVARRRHDRVSSSVLIGLYVASYLVLLGLGR
jgi:cation:H+ antiporter